MLRWRSAGALVALGSRSRAALSARPPRSVKTQNKDLQVALVAKHGELETTRSSLQQLKSMLARQESQSEAVRMARGIVVATTAPALHDNCQPLHFPAVAVPHGVPSLCITGLWLRAGKARDAASHRRAV